MTIKRVAVKKYVVRLSKDERNRLHELIRKGKSPAKQQLKTRVLLKADVAKGGEGWSAGKIIKAFNTSVSMVDLVRQQLVEEGLEAALSRKQRRIFDAEKEAKLVPLACSEAPPGQARWTLSLLANKVVALKIGPPDAGADPEPRDDHIRRILGRHRYHPRSKRGRLSGRTTTHKDQRSSPSATGKTIEAAALPRAIAAATIRRRHHDRNFSIRTLACVAEKRGERGASFLRPQRDGK